MQNTYVNSCFLSGTPVTSKVIEELNMRLEQAPYFARIFGKEPEEVVCITRMTTTILGNSPKNAILFVEIVTEKLPFSPLIASIPLPGTTEAYTSINHDFNSKLEHYNRAIILDFCTELAKTYTFQQKANE